MSGPARRGANGMGELPDWAELESALPQVTATMRRYLTQIGCVLRPGSVNGIDLGLRCFAAFLAATAPEVTCVTGVTAVISRTTSPGSPAGPARISRP